MSSEYGVALLRQLWRPRTFRDARQHTRRAIQSDSDHLYDVAYTLLISISDMRRPAARLHREIMQSVIEIETNF
jgi:hypothetical protein